MPVNLSQPARRPGRTGSAELPAAPHIYCWKIKTSSSLSAKKRARNDLAEYLTLKRRIVHKSRRVAQAEHAEYKDCAKGPAIWVPGGRAQRAPEFFAVRRVTDHEYMVPVHHGHPASCFET